MALLFLIRLVLEEMFFKLLIEELLSYYSVTLYIYKILR